MNFLHMGVLSVCTSANYKGALDPVTILIDGCELSYECWELNSGPQEEQPVLLTAEPSL